PKIKSTCLPMLVGSLVCFMFLIMGWLLNEREDRDLHKMVTAKAGEMAGYVDADMHSRIPAVRRIADRWTVHEGLLRKEFEADARAYVNDLPGFQALEWVDQNYIVRWIIPQAGNERALGLNLASEDTRRIALEKARYSSTPTMTPPIDLVQGGKGFLVYFPIHIRGEFEGFILAVFRAEEWLRHIFSIRETKADRINYRVGVLLNDIRVFSQEKTDDVMSDHFPAAAHVKYLGQDFLVQCRPTTEFIRERRSFLPELTAIVGILISLLLASVVYLFQKTSTAAWRSHAAQRALETEISQRKTTESQLQQTSERLRLATRAGNIGVWTWEIKTDRLTWNELMYDLYDVPADVVPTYDTWRNAIVSEDLAAAEARLREAVEGKSAFDTEFRITRTDGTIRHIRAAARVERDQSGTPLRMTGVNRDITDRKLAEAKIRHLATHDALTDLPSLRLATDRLDQAIRTARRNKTKAGLLFIDLDGFKKVNDTHGHDSGDLLLKAVAGRLLSCVRESDTVARIGGDEFLVIAVDIHSPEDAAGIAEKLIEAMTAPFALPAGTVNVGASIGIALFPDHGQDAEALTNLSDQAMYKVKHSTKNSFAFAGDEAETSEE
ncbi:MAG: diguanylate cyclase, partial [Desulfobacterales bacterium]|nr:diguanylate cyclase [Desulfobacterales bacterium]